MTSPELLAGPSNPVVDRAFALIVAEPDLRSVAEAADREGTRHDVSRIASTLFCSAGLDPSIVSFAKYRTAAHWGLDEDRVDALVAKRLLEKTARLITDLHGAHPRGGVPSERAA